MKALKNRHTSLEWDRNNSSLSTAMTGKYLMLLWQTQGLEFLETFIFLKSL